MAAPDILISECGPRDGLQNLTEVMATLDKCAWIDAMRAAGLSEIEVCSFVPARLMPQMADAAAVVAHARTLPGLTVMALAPNLRGAEAAIAAGVHKITVPVSGSEEHSLANLRRTRAQMVQEVKRVVALRDGAAPHVTIEANVSVAFGCTLAGPVPEDGIIRLSLALVEAGADISGLSDTTGMANPAQTKRLFKRLIAEIGERCGGAHMHNTRGLGLANCLAAYDAGVRTFDSSLGGLGGCPHAPGASGNVATEDLAFMFEAMGVSTGIDMPRLLGARQVLADALPGVALHGMVAPAGLPLGFVPASRS